MARPDVIIHPIRLRIVQAFAADRRLTAQDLAVALPDIPRASLYRHLNTLVEAEILEVTEERPVRAIQERVYALKARAANVGPAEYTATTASEHRDYFLTFLDLLRGDFERYLQRPEPVDIREDGVAYYQMPLYLSDEEYECLIVALRAVLWPVVAQRPEPGRRRRLLSIIAMPGVEGEQAARASDEPYKADGMP